jgi:ATP-dependent RNA helicase HelY
LAEVFSWFSFDREFRYGNRFVLPDRLVLARRRIEDVEHAVLGEERSEGLAISEGHNPNFYGAARAWCRGATMAEISDKIELSEGDLVMTFNKTIDLLRQVGEMLQQVNPELPLRSRFRQAESLLKRDIVEHSLVLGFAPIELPEIARAEIDAARAETPPARKPRSRKSKAAAETVAEPAVPEKPTRKRTTRKKVDAAEPGPEKKPSSRSRRKTPATAER